MPQNEDPEPSVTFGTVHERSDGSTEINIATNNPQAAADLLRERGVPKEFWPQNLLDDLGE